MSKHAVMTPSSVQVPPHHEAEAARTATFGFWVYLMTDCILFATLFVTYGVMTPATFDGPTSSDIIKLPDVLLETLLLLTSSFTSGLALLAGHRGNARQVILWLAVTFVLGAGFVGLELREFVTLIAEGAGPQRSGYLSAFFTLVGTHGAHITAGLVWIGAMTALLARRGLNPSNLKRLTMFTMFWHFLDLVWIFLFSVVYLLGVL